jgi:ABC-type multidrug transport system ATPase subunit
MLKVEHLYVSFTKEFYVLNDINFHLKHGEKMIIVGNKESGRTALLRALLRLEPLAKGEIFYKNINLDKIDFENDISIGYLPAVPVFMEKKSVLENIEYVIKLRTEDKTFVTAKTQNALVEYGLEYIKKKKVKELSYLDRIKLALARLSTRNLEILLIDDIFVKLSSMEKDKLIKQIKAIVKNQSCAVIVMTESEDIAD